MSAYLPYIVKADQVIKYSFRNDGFCVIGPTINKNACILFAAWNVNSDKYANRAPAAIIKRNFYCETIVELLNHPRVNCATL